jgi:hypothetical protein
MTVGEYNIKLDFCFFQKYYRKDVFNDVNSHFANSNGS